MPSLGRFTAIEWVGGCNRCWRMHVRGATTSLPSSTRKLRRLCMFTRRQMRGSGINISQIELTRHRPSRPSIPAAQRSS
ncbi:hypothetical protein Ahy_B04g070728 [Arachis hypogaea]|uniref:Uncharacterized protein n=1 Tax=Arachis hypogaea TaxID=3818 RepID=A0A444ZIN1_ARAHY|nr:hypothetical protein Ahy_B04g070728 [Arachis hypogaea]